MRRAWICSPSWDGFWILSGLPIGAALLSMPYLPVGAKLAFFILVALMETAHAYAPIVLTWAHPALRRLMFSHKLFRLWMPLVAFTIAIAAGVATSLGLTSYKPSVRIFTQMRNGLDWRNPIEMLVWFYMLWNAYHFAMQNFGVLSLYRSKGGGGLRRLDRFYCLVVTLSAMAMSFPIYKVDLPARAGGPRMHLPGLFYMNDLRLPFIAMSLLLTGAMIANELRNRACLGRITFILADGLGLALVWWEPLLGVAIYSINHWTVAIGLASRVSSKTRWWVFTLLLLVIGMTGFLWLSPTPAGNLLGAGLVFRLINPSPDFVMLVMPIVVCVRLGQSFMHFIHDRWLWKMSDPEIRATVGPIFASGELPS
jgi:hypothetical protein